jgi:HME family heavy-metal exporter
VFKQIISFSLKRPALVLVIAGALLVFAGYTVPRMPVDVFPELNAPTVVVLTEAGGLAADEVETYVTFPIETAMTGMPGVRRVRSASAISLSLVWVEFDFGADIYRARQLVAEKLATVEEQLPEKAHAEIAPITSITGEVMLISLSSPDGTVSPLEMRAYAEYELRNQLLSVSGIAQVVAIGGELPEYQVNVRQDDLRLYGLTVLDVAEAAGKSHATASAGYMENVEGLELPVRQTGRVRSAEDIKQTVIKFHNGTPVRLQDVADVELAGAPKRGTGSEDGHPAVIVSIQKNPGTNTLMLTEEILQTLEEARATAPEGLVINDDVMRQSHFIDMAVGNVVRVLIEASIFVAIILILFLMNVRTTVITLTALPLSLAVAMVILWAWGQTINVMTLGGLAVAIGELVDDAIIDVENVFRRLRENALLPESERKSHIRVVFNASNEIRSSVVFATIIIALVFVPLLFLQGLEGRFFRPLGIAYITSIMASLLVALTVTPALCKFMLKKVGKGGHDRESRLVRLLKRMYMPSLRGALRLRWAVIVLALAASVGSLYAASTFGTRFLPDFNEGSFTIFLMAPPGTSLEESNRIATGVEKRLAEIEGVRTVARRTGRAERDEHAEPVSSSEIDVSIQPGYTKDEVRREIDKVIAQVPGITTMVGQPIEHRLSHLLSGTPAAITVNVYGEDLPTIRKIIKEIEVELRSLPGARDVAATREVMVETLPIEYSNEELGRYGLTPVDAAQQVEAALAGVTVDEINQGKRQYRLTVRLAREDRNLPEQVERILLRGMDGALVELRQIALVGRESASNLIARENGRRKGVISCNVAEGYNMGDLVAQVQERVDPIVQKHAYSVHYGGQFEAQQSASRTILVMGAGAIVAILFLLYLALGSFRSASLVMVNLPLALIGGVVAIFIAESPNVIENTKALFGIGDRPFVNPVISIASMVGFVTLFGIAVRNGILLVTHYQNLMMHERLDLRNAILKGSSERLVPILMTALSAMLALIPLVLAAGEPGSELLAPLAIVVLGGLVTSTFLNLVVVPAGFFVFGPKSMPRDVAEDLDDSLEKEKEA